ncbi:hypothetical protein ABT024_34500 [Streptomyces sp. NPDC002812]|uniref:hypothetical protein n=1 Tax=unclassified Streptomyces TaxID=2593676 RepID=UPI00225BFBA5|nr:MULTISPECIES: hypothetical protein [unclassified Streptomyces]MCX5125000.1 hypothetical protein [Streptomyces sp. NBC_00347]MCX5299181.1 hypothetical protein [Streptomyces sp. NBC_00193]
MTTRAVHTSRSTSGAQPPATRPGAGRRFLRAAAIAATVPYLTLKTAWLAGSHIGIPDGSVLLEPGSAFFTVLNGLSLVMDSSVVLLVLVLTRPWGMRVPSWLMVLPVFIATGLLTPIVLGFPGQLLLRSMGGGPGEAAQEAQPPFLDPWVFNVVYPGFIIQAIALAGLFVPYARERWGRRWQGVLGERLPSPTGVVAGAAAAVAAVVAATHVYWAFGGTAGHNADQIAQYSSDTGVVSFIHAICALTAAAGAVLLARGGDRRAWWPLAVAWTGSAATLCWGMWMMTAVLGGDPGPGERTTTATYLIYPGQMIVGLLAVSVMARFLATRRAA